MTNDLRTCLIKAHACHEDTVVLLDLTEAEFAAVRKVSAALAEESNGDCMPTLKVRIATPTDVAEYTLEPDEDD